MVELEGVDRGEHAADGARRARPVFHCHKGDNVVGEAETDVPVEGGLSQSDGNRDEKSVGPVGIGRAPRKVGVEFTDICGVGQRVAGTKAKDG